MPGKALGVERELRWRIKHALDAAGIRIVGGLPGPSRTRRRPDPTAGMAAPSACSTRPSRRRVPDRRRRRTK